MNRLTQTNVLKKAIMYECITDATTRSLIILNDVATFYVQLEGKFKYIIHSDTLDKNENLLAAKEYRFGAEWEEWLNEHNILYFFNHRRFLFTNEEDAVAFKLRWG